MDRELEGIESLRDEILANGGFADIAVVDISRESDVAEMVETTVATHGRIDCAFNNAGVEQKHVMLHEMEGELWSKSLAVNLTGTFYCLKHEVSAMLKSGGGSIVNTASDLGLVAIPRAAEYIAAKHGVIGLTKSAAVEYGASGIRVNAILPGIIRTPMIERAIGDPTFADAFDALRVRHPVGRLGLPNEIAETAAWLLSDAASYVTGISLPVDGGFLALA